MAPWPLRHNPVRDGFDMVLCKIFAVSLRSHSPANRLSVALVARFTAARDIHVIHVLRTPD